MEDRHRPICRMFTYIQHWYMVAATRLPVAAVVTGHGLQDGSCAGRARVGECAAAGAACGAAPPRLRAVRAHRCAAAEVRLPDFASPHPESLRPMHPACVLSRPSLITCMAADIQHSGPCLFLHEARWLTIDARVIAMK